MKLLKDTMVENEPEAKQDPTDHKKAPAGMSGNRRASTAHTSKPLLR